MALFPQTFLDDLKAQIDIVSVIGDVTPLKKAGATYKGLCPFHTEKTPSFTVSKDKGFFKCFGCGAGGDVFKFVELHQKATFPEVVRYLAQRASVPIPETVDGADDRVASAEREALVKLHDDAQVFFLEQLTGPTGARARQEVESRGRKAAPSATVGYRDAPAGGRATIHSRF
jgi:DNA primase